MKGSCNSYKGAVATGRWEANADVRLHTKKGGNKVRLERVSSCMAQSDVIALPTPTKTSTATWVGLFLSLFSMLIIRQVTRLIVPDPGPTGVFLKEIPIWVSAVTLLWLITKKERLPLSSIGIGTSKLWKSAAWGLAAGAVSLAAGGFLAHLTQ